jgi:hypothetical protein
MIRKSPFTQLLEARLEYYHATPGSREWWAAIRKMRSANQRLQDALSDILAGFRDLLDSVHEAFRPLAELAAELQNHQT